MQKNIYGKSGEIIAAEFLKKQDYNIIEMNYKNKIGEIDIIAKDGDCIVFVEVKTRMSKAFGDPLEAINETKQIKIRQVATLYLIKHRLLNAKCRFDAIGITGASDYEIKHVKDCF